MGWSQTATIIGALTAVIGSRHGRLAARFVEEVGGPDAANRRIEELHGMEGG